MRAESFDTRPALAKVDTYSYRKKCTSYVMVQGMLQSALMYLLPFRRVKVRVKENPNNKNYACLVTICTDHKRNAGFAEEARKARLQLVRARKDLRALWLERDELAILAGKAMQVRGTP